jgi:hypothetical protein
MVAEVNGILGGCSGRLVFLFCRSFLLCKLCLVEQ